MFQKITRITRGWGALTIINFVYDDVLYPFTIYKLGAIYGGIIMTLGSIISCFFLLLWYEKKKKDWLGVNVFENIKQNGFAWIKKLELKANKNIFWKILKFILYIPSRIFLLVLWLLKQNDFVAFFALCIFQDPFVTTVFLRHGRFDGLKRKDWIIFTLSVIVSNGYWILRNVLLVDIILWMF